VAGLDPFVVALLGEAISDGGGVGGHLEAAAGAARRQRGGPLQAVVTPGRWNRPLR
jgi:hypothetical protein